MPLNLGLVGCGSFARSMHVPLLRQNPKFKIHSVMDISEEAARSLGEETGAVLITTSIDELLSDPKLDAVLITTRHDSHAELTIKAASFGKHVLCEKPMGLSRAECRAVVEAVRKNGVVYTVGYNRGMAPMITKARDLLATLPEVKKMIYHRIQAPFPESSWTHLPEIGGGRFVGEGCHIFDLLCELVGKPPVSVHTAGGTFLDPSIVKIPDSGIVTITFADGSVATTLIASAGCADFPKEATEIYCANKAIFIHDFKHMESYGFEGQKRTVLDFDSVDKGHAVELDQFADAVLTGAPAPNGLLKASRAAVISYLAGESVSSGSSLAICEDDYTF